VLPLRIERNIPGRDAVERSASGPLFYTANLRYGIPAELASPHDEGFSVFSEILDADGNPVRDGRLVPGKTYTRRVLVSGSRDRTFMALRIPVPSGAEIIDAMLVTSPTIPPAEEGEAPENREAAVSVQAEGRVAGDTDAAGYFWYDILPVRFVMDDEVRFHWDYFPAGRQEVQFRFRAVMPGIYPTPPAQAECMYEEEVFGRAAGELIRIGE
jgi:uncharacterized protein YfaS (alpha-2-macroglobulin family)